MKINGVYVVLYKSPKMPNERIRGQFLHKLSCFVGECENFTTRICAFRNEENEFLLVDYEDIVQMHLAK
ncbi:hypothetical protein JK635_02395 [Neobacillus sp. YIM B02564]|uniref:Uncharacterized protein n=1 Tax=Neobacillus paridis TaxID=2803862 RepID=A0ABS1TMF9_9BACI|nr:hypothetical protein [Neobacillus paridis]MBL4951090.1 hypothetical protein [Neobacillus paridis]